MVSQCFREVLTMTVTSEGRCPCLSRRTSGSPISLNLYPFVGVVVLVGIGLSFQLFNLMIRVHYSLIPG